MNIELYYPFLLNIILNSILSFVTVALLVESILFLLRVNNQRFMASCRLLPIAKLLFDIFHYNFSSWALFKGINPLNLEAGTRQLGVVFHICELHPTTNIQLSTLDGSTFTFADILFLISNPSSVKALVALFAISSLCILLFKMIKILHEHKKIRSICHLSTLCQRRIFNAYLSSKIIKLRVKVVESKTTHAPFTMGFLHPLIVIPKCLIAALTQDEFEAIIAHEVEHIRWKDPLIKLITTILRVIFWWVPLKAFAQRLELSQELACDNAVERLGIDRLCLASALTKTYENFHQLEGCALCSLVRKGSFAKRIATLLTTSKQKKNKVFLVLQTIICCVFFSSLFLGKIWLF